MPSGTNYVTSIQSLPLKATPARDLCHTEDGWVDKKYPLMKPVDKPELLQNGDGPSILDRDKELEAQVLRVALTCEGS